MIYPECAFTILLKGSFSLAQFTQISLLAVFSLVYFFAFIHNTLRSKISQCWFNVGPASRTLAQHWTSIKSTLGVGWYDVQATLAVWSVPLLEWLFSSGVIFIYQLLVRDVTLCDMAPPSLSCLPLLDRPGWPPMTSDHRTCVVNPCAAETVSRKIQKLYKMSLKFINIFWYPCSCDRIILF